ncbi:hypothetical protein B0H13DRAFT_2300107 [Mycena leptocephala]|nr:hypothetical protein B0H13DRAFT_2300107 [Mycena leptocephala]
MSLGLLLPVHQLFFQWISSESMKGYARVQGESKSIPPFAVMIFAPEHMLVTRRSLFIRYKSVLFAPQHFD